LSSPEEIPMPLPTRGDELLHLAPIDFVVRAIHHIGMQPAAVGRTFHLTDPRPPTVRQALQLVAQHGGKRLPAASLPANLTQALLKTPGVHLVSKNQRAFLEVVRTRVRYDTSGADELLKPAGIRCPSFESYAEQLVQYVRSRLQSRRVFDRSGEIELEDPIA
jgi:hypothetical protein